MDVPYGTGRTQVGTAGSYTDDPKVIMDELYMLARPLYEALSDTGSLFLMCDFHLKFELYMVMTYVLSPWNKKNLINEIIWNYDYGARTRKYWPRKHDTLFWFAKDPNNYIYNYDAIDRIPYMAPGLVGPEKAARGKTPTDVWWNTIVPTQGKERTGYATQKPLSILDRIIRVHTNPGSWVLDPMAGSGTTGVACRNNGRNAIMGDTNIDAIKVMLDRLGETAFVPET